MRSTARLNRLVDELRDDLRSMTERIERLENALEVAFPGRFLHPDQRRLAGDDAGTGKL